jgi:hypothetical protein
MIETFSYFCLALARWICAWVVSICRNPSGVSWSMVGIYYDTLKAMLRLMEASRGCSTQSILFI